MNKCRTLVQKEYKTRHDWEEKVINKEQCKNIKFDHTLPNNIFTNQYPS